jgi:hypothetical protein
MRVLCKPMYIYEFTVEQIFEKKMRFIFNNILYENLAIVM